MSITRREAVILFILALLACACLLVPQKLINQYEILLLLVTIVPLAIYLLTDGEHVKHR